MSLPRREKGHCQRWNQRILQCNSLCNNVFPNGHRECLEHQAFYTRKKQHCRLTLSMPPLVFQPRLARGLVSCSEYRRLIQNWSIQIKWHTTSMVMVGSYTLKVMFFATKKGELTAKEADLKVPMGLPLGSCVCAVSPHCTIVLSAPSPSIVMNAFIGGMFTFSLHTFPQFFSSLLFFTSKRSLYCLNLKCYGKQKRNKTTNLLLLFTLFYYKC